MVLVFMISAVFFAMLNDRTKLDRRKVLACAVVFWSVATSLAGLANSLPELLFYRSLVGVGEAAFGTIVPPFLSDFFPPSERNPVFGFFYLAIPVGGAIGYAVGAIVGSSFGWRVAFFVCGLPGVVVSMLILLLKDPPRGINDISSPSSPTNVDTTTEPDNSSVSITQEYALILKNKHFIVGVLGTSANLFALGGLADWYASFAMRHEGSSLAEAGLVVGAVTIVAGIGGNLLGSVASQYWEHRVKSAYFLIPSLFTLPGAFFLCIALNVTNKWASFFALALAEICLWTYLAPLSALSINVLDTSLRARGMALAILIQHILGDVISPPIIGVISDAIGLRTALQITWMAVLVSGVLWYGGYAFLSPLPVTKLIRIDTDDNKQKKSVHGKIFSLLLGWSAEEEEGNEETFSNPMVTAIELEERSLKLDNNRRRSDSIEDNSSEGDDENRKNSDTSESELLEDNERSLV